jgi:hypothetical protein
MPDKSGRLVQVTVKQLTGVHVEGWTARLTGGRGDVASYTNVPRPGTTCALPQRSVALDSTVYVVCVVGVKGNVQLAFHPVALNMLILNPEAADLSCP